MSTIRFGEVIIKDTHRGLWYQDGKMSRVLEAEGAPAAFPGDGER